MGRFLIAIPNHRRGGFNVGIGMALPGQQSQRSSGHRLRHHTGKSPVNLNAPVRTSRRWGWLPHRMVPLEHDPEKPTLGLDPRVETGFPKRSCSN